MSALTRRLHDEKATIGAPKDAGKSILVYERSFGESGSGPGQFRLPRHICTLPSGDLCVSDFLNQRLQIVSPQGRYVGTLCDAQGSAPGKLNGPSGVCCEATSFFVAEGGNHRVQKLLLADASPISRAGKHGKNPGDLWCPHGIAVAKRSTFADEVARSDGTLQSQAAAHSLYNRDTAQPIHDLYIS